MHGKWCYLYRAIDADGNLIDSRLSEKRDMEAAKCFFQQALETVGHAPERVTTDGHDSYSRAIRETGLHPLLWRQGNEGTAHSMSVNTLFRRVVLQKN